MIRLFIGIGIVGTVLLAFMSTYGQGPDYQMAPKVSLLKQFEAQGVVPNANDLSENEEVEHEIFEVPPEDEEQLKMAMKNMASMPGMDMGGMKMDDNAPKMKLNPDGTMAVDADGNMIMEPAEGTAMKMEGKEKPAMKMKLNPDGTMMVDADGNMVMEPAEGTAMKMEGKEKPAMKMDDKAPKMKLNPDGTMMTNSDGSMVMEGEEKTAMKKKGEEAPHAADEAAEEAPHGAEGEGGLKITEEGSFDREIDLAMEEWGYSNLNIEVKTGERIRFNLTNNGKIPHEFMFMTMPAMMAINYRVTRADWSLLEHEALYEKSLVLPGGKFSFIAEIKKDGSWMFMCMLPYHMQMGMMGQMATPGMAMDMRM